MNNVCFTSLPELTKNYILKHEIYISRMCIRRLVRETENKICREVFWKYMNKLKEKLNRSHTTDDNSLRRNASHNFKFN